MDKKSPKKSSSPDKKFTSPRGKHNSTVRRPLHKIDKKKIAVTENQDEFNIKIPPVPIDEDGKMYHMKLKEFAEDHSQKEFEFPSTMNVEQRKRLHEIAEDFGFLHFSRGSKNRFITVQKNTHEQEDEWQYSRYIALFGPRVNEKAKKDTDIVPLSQINQRMKRDGPMSHITFMLYDEISSVLKNPSLVKMMKDGRIDRDIEEDGIELLMSYIGERVHDDWLDLGLGNVKQDNNETWFKVVEWKSANDLRRSLNLEPKDFHITVGFLKSDIHDVRKNSKTLILENLSKLSLDD